MQRAKRVRVELPLKLRAKRLADEYAQKKEYTKRSEAYV
jgi:metal-responsive CopG/Arc/MetJ family transcriptional regulator